MVAMPLCVGMIVLGGWMGKTLVIGTIPSQHIKQASGTELCPLPASPRIDVGSCIARVVSVEPVT